MESPRVFAPAKSKYLVITTDYLIPFGIIVFIIAFFCFVAFSSFFKVKTLECTLDFTECTDPSVLSELEKLKGQNIFRLAEDSVIAKLTSGDFTIRTVDIQKTLPDTLKVELQSVYPVVALKVESDPSWVVLDDKFRVIARRDIDPNVATVIVTTPLTLTVGKVIPDEAILSTLKLALRLSSELIATKDIKLIDKNTIQITLRNDDLTVLFSPSQDELRQIRSLQAVLSGSTIIKDITTIDVRFIQPVLR